MPGAPPQRVLVAESDPALRRLLSRRLLSEGYEVIELADPAGAAAKVIAIQPDLTMLETGGEVGFDPLLAVRDASDRPLIALLWTDPVNDEAMVLDLGADDCLTRPLSFRTLLARTRAVLRRTNTAVVRRLSFGALDIDLAGRAVTVGGQDVELSAREFDLLAFLASRPGEAFSRDQLLASVWRSSASWQQPETVTEHVHRLRSRIEQDPSRPRWLLTVRGVGYRFSPSSDDGRSSMTKITPSISSRTASGVETTRHSID